MYRCAIAMEQKNFALIGKDNQIVTISSGAAQLSKQNINQFFFPNADENDLVNIKDCLETEAIICSMRYQVGKEAYDVSQNYADRTAEKLSVQQLVKLSNNVNLFFTKGNPEPLVRSIFQKVKMHTDSKDFFELPLSVKNVICFLLLEQTFLRQVEYEFNCISSSYMTDLLSPYSKILNQSTILASYYKSPAAFLPKIVKPCIYVGDKITALLSGVKYQDNPFFCNYQLILHTQEGVKFFALQEGPNVDFDINIAFANKDESCFVCTYKNIIDDSNKGLFIVNTKNYTSKKIPYSYTACCFGLNNEIYGFGSDDTIWILDIDTKKISPFSCATALDGSLEKFKNIRGMLNYKNRNKFLFYTDHNFFYAKRRKKVSTEFVLKSSACQFSSPRVITDVIMDPIHLNLCIKTRDAKSNILDSRRDIFLLGFKQSRSHDIPLKTVYGKSPVSFSSDGNLFIISSRENDKTKYTFFDISTSTSWCKWSDNEVLHCGAGKSIEQKENLLTSEVCSVTLVDDNMQEAYSLLTTKNSSVTQHPFDILLPTIAYLQKSHVGKIDDSLPLPIKNILAVSSQSSKVISQSIVSYPRALWNRISTGMLSYSRLFFGFIVITVFVKMLKNV